MRGGLRLAGLVDCDDPELVPLALAEAGHPRFQVVDLGTAVGVVGDERVEPAAEFVLLLNDVVRDGPAAVVFRLGPLQRDRLVVEVGYLRLTRLAWRSWEEKTVRLGSVLSLIPVIAEWNFDNDFAMLTVGVLSQDGIAGEYWLGLTLLVDGGDFKLVEVAWFQALGSGAAAARLRRGNNSNSRKYHGAFEKARLIVLLLTVQAETHSPVSMSMYLTR